MGDPGQAGSRVGIAQAQFGLQHVQVCLSQRPVALQTGTESAAPLLQAHTVNHCCVHWKANLSVRCLCPCEHPEVWFVPPASSWLQSR